MSSYLTHHTPLTRQNVIDDFQTPHKASLGSLEFEMAAALEDANPQPLPNTLIINASSSGFDGSNDSQMTINGKKVVMQPNENGNLRGLHLAVINPEQG